MEKLYYTAKEVAEMLDVSVSHAYKVIREANRELSSKGFYVRAGRVSRKYLDSKVYDLCDKTAQEKGAVVWQHTRMRRGGHGMSPSTTTIGQVKTKES